VVGTYSYGGECESCQKNEYELFGRRPGRVLFVGRKVEIFDPGSIVQEILTTPPVIDLDLRADGRILGLLEQLGDGSLEEAEENTWIISKHKSSNPHETPRIRQARQDH
jgi:hypothetical protein